MDRSWIPAVVVVAASFGAATTARAEPFKNVNECVPGTRVETAEGYKGKITRIDRAWSYCYVLRDEDRKEVGYLYSLLRPEGSAAPDDNIVPGTYECVSSGGHVTMYMRVTGANTYEAGMSTFNGTGKPGRFHVEPSKRVVFDSGPMVGFHAHALVGPAIGLKSSESGTFYTTRCELRR